MSHSPNPHTNLLNVFIQIANNKGRYYKKKLNDEEFWTLEASLNEPQINTTDSVDVCSGKVKLSP
jgi:hypothetical protein